MTDDDFPTLNETGTGRSPDTSAAPTTFALVLAWCADQPDRLGESLMLPAAAGSPWSVFGRGDAAPSDPHPRLTLVRARPGRVESAAPLTNPRLSRVQLRLAPRGDQGVSFERLGRAPLFHNGGDREIDHGLLHAGDTLQIGKQLMFLLARRPAWQAPMDQGPDARPFPFGAPDPLGLVGESPEMWRLRAHISFLARRREHVLITGASGTGKEKVAHALHSLSSARPLVARNAATFPEGLIDAELFGNARNYPNVGMPERPGLIGEANGSTLFLDEIGELPVALQAHLLRVLDAGEYQRLGEGQTRRSTFRLLAATNRPYAALKSDLLARLPLRIEVPDLNVRRDDIPLLARYLVREIAPGTRAEGKISLGLMSALVRHQYSTNVRELRSALLESAAHAAGPESPLTWVPPALAPRSPRADGMPAADRDPPPPLAMAAELDPTRIQEVLDRHHGNLELAWRELGLSSRHALTRLVSRHGLHAGRSWRPRSSES
ncbi:MAG TPA: sigma 54-interacting transcriptional regulator [Polyangia bacterium]|jgi:two-component system nitrogen regulation response regulator GlnG/two-component system response regulator HydG|nr:sigma 54-interacting transcriptional regulator [Polyangia bacterium]